MRQYSLRELIFGVIAAGAVVGMITNNYWMEIQVKRAKADRQEVCFKAYLRKIDELELKNMALETAKNILAEKLDNFVPMERDINTGIWYRGDNEEPANNNDGFYFRKDSRIIYVKKDKEK